ncbi:MAG: hypothetical protein JNM13_03585 [Hyphomicrobiaceae bacterium]|nr:hypothetical protein [Hyphomicrobiaceae bacterium]
MQTLMDRLRQIREEGSYADFDRLLPQCAYYFTNRGWHQCLLTQIPLPGGPQNPLTILNTIEPEFCEEYHRLELFKYDNHQIALLKLGRPVSRIECINYCADRERAEAFEQIVEAFRFGHGVVVPLFDYPLKRLAFIACGTGPDPTARDLLEVELMMRELVGTFFHLNQNAKFKSDSLTNQERRVLEGAARGNSSERIAELLSISTNTVNVHITNCQRKLQSSNRVETVAKALFYREILLDPL